MMRLSSHYPLGFTSITNICRLLLNAVKLLLCLFQLHVVIVAYVFHKCSSHQHAHAVKGDCQKTILSIFFKQSLLWRNSKWLFTLMFLSGVMHGQSYEMCQCCGCARKYRLWWNQGWVASRLKLGAEKYIKLKGEHLKKFTGWGITVYLLCYSIYMHHYTEPLYTGILDCKVCYFSRYDSEELELNSLYRREHLIFCCCAQILKYETLSVRQCL